MIEKVNIQLEFGKKSEDLACLFLEQEGFFLIERNYFARKMGEIDIIARKDDIFHFIEVKSAKADFDPIYNVTKSKLRKVINSANYYMKVKKLDVSFSIDVILIRDDEVEFLENVTL